MLENLPPILKSIGTAASALKALSHMRSKTKGDIRSIVEELRGSFGEWQSIDPPKYN